METAAAETETETAAAAAAAAAESRDGAVGRERAAALAGGAWGEARPV